MNILTCNCRGLDKLKKIKQVMGRIKELHEKINFLQQNS